MEVDLFATQAELDKLLICRFHFRELPAVNSKFHRVNYVGGGVITENDFAFAIDALKQSSAEDNQGY